MTSPNTDVNPEYQVVIKREFHFRPHVLASTPRDSATQTGSAICFTAWRSDQQGSQVREKFEGSPLRGASA